MLQIKKNFQFYICFFVFLFLAFKQPELQPDSGSYENFSIIRIGFYPLIIAAFKFLFKSYAFKFLVVFQSLLATCSAYFLSNFLSKKFNLPFLMHLCVTLFFIFPSVFNCSSNTILSEAVAYPLFLISVLFFCKLVVFELNKYNLAFACFLFILCFTRQQFVFLYVVALIYSIYVFLIEKKIQLSFKILLASIISISCFFLSERTYHYVFHGHFAGTPFVGTQLLMRPLFVANQKALNSITDEKQKLFLNETVKQLKELEIINPDEGLKELSAYEYFYNTMYHKISASVWGKVWNKEKLEKEFNLKLTNFQATQIVDKNCLEMAFKLVENNSFSFLIYYLKDVIRGMGGYSFVLFLFIIFSKSFFSVIIHKNRKDLASIIAMLSIIMHLGNSSLVCLFEPPLTRYTYPTATFLIAIIFIFLFQIKFNNQKENLCVE